MNEQLNHTSESQENGSSGPNWLLIGGIIVVLLLVVVAIFGLLREQPAGPEEPGETYIAIISPERGDVLPVSETVTVVGQAQGIVNNNALVVQVLDTAGNLIVEQPATVGASEVGARGDWEVALSVPAEEGAEGLIFVFSTSPEDGSILTSASVEVSFGSAEEEPPTEEAPPTEEPPTEEPPEDQLIGPIWTVEMILPQFVTPVEGVVHELEEPVEGTPDMTLVFKDDDTIEAYGGCNRFEARWEADERELKFEEIRIPGEPSACVEPPGTLDQESHYISLIERVERYYLIQAGDEVTLILIEVREAENDLEQPLLEFQEK